MEFGIFIGFILMLGIVIYVNIKKKQPKLTKETIPDHLGVLDDVPITPLFNKLNEALDEDYKEQVKKRFLQENPKLTTDEFEWRFFELKRYFVLTKILKSTPMFSEDVDDVWHTMLLFTQKYQSFSEKFSGKMLHHHPNTNPTPQPQERAFFDWIFSQVFSITEYSWKAWGSFFNHPINSNVLNDFKYEKKQVLVEKYFNVNEDNQEMIEYIIDQLKQQLNRAEAIYTENKKGDFTKQKTYGDMSSLSLVMVFYSYFYFDSYWAYAKAYVYASASSTTSGCSTAVFCGVGSNRSNRFDDSDSPGDGGEDSSCSSCSSSSCSSCGSGCSS